MVTCDKCKYWQPPSVATKVQGKCRRHSPAHLSTKSEALWPLTHPHDYCGEGEPKDEEASDSKG